MARSRLRTYGREMPVEIACDESGFTGGNLTFRHAVFSHASVLLSWADADAEMRRLRERVAAHGELKASWLLRWCDIGDLQRLLGPDGLLGDGARVHLTDIRLFLLARLCDALLGTREVRGLDLPGIEPDTWATARRLRHDGEQLFGRPRWQAFLTSAGNALRTNSHWVPATAVSDFEADLAGLAAAAPPGSALQEVFRRLRADAGRVRAVRRALVADPHRSPLLEPLLPALDRAIEVWGAAEPRLVVVHDEQSALTTWRVSAMAARLASRHPAHTATLVRVDSQDDPRVQIADLVAGIARRAAVGVLTGEPDDELIALVQPLVDERSIWPDDF